MIRAIAVQRNDYICKFFLGNTWGTCKNGTEGMGCGDQEMFRNCADIQIYSSVVGYPPNAIDIPSAIYLRDNTAPTGRRPLIIKCVNRKRVDFYSGL